MRRLIASNDIETVWFGAAAPLALLAPRARSAGARRVIASTHGHEVGWSMLPLARSALRRIGDGTDVVTYVSQLHPRPVRVGVRVACRAGIRAAGRGHRPVRPGSGRPRGDAVAVRARRAARHRVPVPAGTPQGPGHADSRPARDPRARRRRRPVIVGGGPYLAKLHRLAREAGVTEHVVFTGGCPAPNCPPTTRWPTCSRCRAVPAAQALTSRASASSTWRRRRRACRSSQATRVGRRRPCRTARRGASLTGQTSTKSPRQSAKYSQTQTRAAEMGAAGRRWAVDQLAVAQPGRATALAC